MLFCLVIRIKKSIFFLGRGVLGVTKKDSHWKGRSVHAILNFSANRAGLGGELKTSKELPHLWRKKEMCALLYGRALSFLLFWSSKDCFPILNTLRAFTPTRRGPYEHLGGRNALLSIRRIRFHKLQNVAYAFSAVLWNYHGDIREQTDAPFSTAKMEQNTAGA